MAGITAPKRIVQLVNELVCWYETHDSRNPLSYPSATAEARAGYGGAKAAQAIVPLVQMPARLAVIDRALNQMPEEMQLAVLCRHLADYQTYQQETGNSRSTYYNQADSGYWYMAGVTNTDCA